jgi:hypothetical protein
MNNAHIHSPGVELGHDLSNDKEYYIFPCLRGSIQILHDYSEARIDEEWVPKSMLKAGFFVDILMSRKNETSTVIWERITK